MSEHRKHNLPGVIDGDEQTALLAEIARDNPPPSRLTNLTPYDLGEVLQPHIWDMSDEGADFGYGFVDFDDDEGTTICMVRTTRRRGGGYILVVEDHSTGTETSVVVGL